jgi:tetratricopeptide (TPR) repeat protein
MITSAATYTSIILEWFRLVKYDLEEIFIILTKIFVISIKILIVPFMFILIYKIYRWSCKKENVVLPFDVAAGKTEYSGQAISNMLIAEWHRIREIHTFLDAYIKTFPDVYIKNPNLQSLQQGLFQATSTDQTTMINSIGTIQAGGISISIGALLSTLKSGSRSFISGSLQKCGKEVSLVLCIEKGRNKIAWSDNYKTGDDICISDMIRNIGFRGFQYLWENCPTKTLEGFKFYTETLDIYNKYIQKGTYYNKRYELLESLWHCCRKLLECDPQCYILVLLLYDLGFMYHDNDDFIKAEYMFRQALKKLEEINISEFPPYIMKSWGRHPEPSHCKAISRKAKHKHFRSRIYGGLAESLKVLARDDKSTLSQRHAWNEEAAKAYKEAIKICKYPLYYSGLGYVYTALENYDCAISAFKLAIKKTSKKKTSRYHASLAGLYRRLGRIEEYLREIALAHKFLKWEKSVYNRAWIEALTIGREKEALELLEIALEKKEVTPLWVRRDPDVDFIRHIQKFKDLTNPITLPNIGSARRIPCMPFVSKSRPIKEPARVKVTEIMYEKSIG